MITVDESNRNENKNQLSYEAAGLVSNHHRSDEVYKVSVATCRTFHEHKMSKLFDLDPVVRENS